MSTVLQLRFCGCWSCRRCHIAVGTPGRVGSLLETGVLQPGKMRTLVLDEADQLMTESFAEDVRCAAARKRRHEQGFGSTTGRDTQNAASQAFAPICTACNE